MRWLFFLALAGCPPVEDGDSLTEETPCNRILARDDLWIVSGVERPEDIAWFEFDVSNDGWQTYEAPNTAELDEEAAMFYLGDPDSCPAGWSSRLTWAYLSEYSSAFNVGGG